MKTNTMKFLRRIADTDDGALPLTKANARAADELVALGYVQLFHISTGGADVAITRAGLDWIEVQTEALAPGEPDGQQ